MSRLDVHSIRRDFPILEVRVHQNLRLVYLDNAATTQKPRAVIERIARYYEQYNANVHRAIHELGEKATRAYEEARDKTAEFINAPSARQIVFLKNATEAINLVAYSLGRTLGPDDEVLVTQMEHHSNLVPWQIACRRTGARLRYIPLNPDGTLNLDSLDELLNERTKLVAFVHVSNVLGTINPVDKIVQRARQVGARVLIDGAQSVPHMPVDVQQLDCDFLVFSGHKMLGPTGIGVLYGKENILEEMEPFLGGGEMISRVSMEESDWNDIPYKFEAGTPNIAGAIGLGAAIDYLQGLGMENVHAYEQQLTRYALERLEALGDDVHIYGPKDERGGLIAFNYGNIHPHDLSTVLDQEGVAIRAGHHCAQPIMTWLDVPATARASFYIYNDENDVDALVRALQKAKEFFGDVPR